MNLHVKVVEDGRKTLTEMEQRLDLDDAWPKIGEEALRETREAFESEVDPDGVPWPALTAEYARRKRGGRGILRLTGHLFGSLDWQLDNDGVAIGPLRGTPPYAAVHNSGSRNTPQREYIGLRRETIDALHEGIGDYIESGKWSVT